MEMHDRSGLKNRNFAAILAYIVIGTFLLVFNINSKLSAGKINENNADTCTCKVQIAMIDSTEEAYFLYAINEKNSSQIALVSLKSKTKHGESIEISKSYLLKLYPYYAQDIFPNHMIVFDVTISDRKIKVPSIGWASNVYTSPDLSGLRIIVNNEDK